MKETKATSAELISPDYAYSNARMQAEYRQWLHKVGFDAPYALTLTASRPTVYKQTKLATMKRMSII